MVHKYASGVKIDSIHNGVVCISFTQRCQSEISGLEDRIIESICTDAETLFGMCDFILGEIKNFQKTQGGFQNNKGDASKNMASKPSLNNENLKIGMKLSVRGIHDD